MSKKIMFSDKFSLTEAVLDGRKTQTRRIIPKEFFTLTWDVRDDTLVYENDFGDFIDVKNSTYNRFKIGDVVAVAQAYDDFYNDDYNPIMFPDGAGWTNKMFVKSDLMPHRIRITDVRVERLQDISDEDCMKEGVGVSATDNIIGYPIGIRFNYYIGEDKRGNRYILPREAFSVLIDKVSGRGTWESNPYVFAYEFELVR